MEGMQIKVTTEKLNQVADQVDAIASDLKNRFQRIDAIVNRSAQYWEAEGQKRYLNKYSDNSEAIEIGLHGFVSNAQNLRAIAAGYVQAEATAMEYTESLSDNVII